MLKTEARLSTVCLALIGVVDLLSTMALLMLGMAEGNPLFGWILRYGLLPFALAKIAFIAGPILVLEWARKSHPQTAEQATWIAFIAYLLLWGFQLLRIA